jgi:hypothetical protein
VWATDVAVLTVGGSDFSPLALAASSAVKTGNKICTIGYPNIQMQGHHLSYLSRRQLLNDDF